MSRFCALGLTGIGGLAETERYTLHLPWRAPFADPAIFEHPAVLQLLELYWQADDFRITCMHSNTPYPGSVTQRWHRDGGGEGGGQPSGRSPGLGLKFPLCSTSELNGSFELVPGTHLLADYVQPAGSAARGTETVSAAAIPTPHCAAAAVLSPGPA